MGSRRFWRRWGSAPRRGVDAASVALLTVVTTVPLLLTAPGKVPADTKQYLYLDPGRFLREVPFIWDPKTHLGTVTHQSVGYLWPMGPYYWVMQRIGAPDWVAQRLWIAAILLGAGIGVLFLARTLRWRPGPALVAALVYSLSPYVLDYVARISVILLSFAALPWLVALTIRALRSGSWREPAVFALIAMTAGSVNASALIFVGIAPILWLPFAVWGLREATPRQALATAGRIGVLTLGASLWWLSGLAIQGRYGPPILAESETLDAITVTAVSLEVLRGLGYWFFYGDDKVGPWIRASRTYTQQIWVLVLSYTLPILGVVGGFVTRWRERAYFVLLVGVGMLVAVGAHPFSHPPLVGRIWRDLAVNREAFFALRSTGRATPLVVLGLAMMLAAALSGLARRLHRTGAVAMVLVGILAFVNLSALWRGKFVDPNLERDSQIPSYWLAAAKYLDQHDDGTRVLEIPGIDFAAYRWGNTVDPITPGLIDRPYAARELIGLGTAPANDLLIALDRRYQERIDEPGMLAPIARLMGVGDVVVRSDLQYERYRTPRPRLLWHEVTQSTGLAAPVGFGTPRPNRPVPQLPMVDEIHLGSSPDLPDPPPVADFPVKNAEPIVRVASSAHPLVVAGSGEGLVDAAAAGLIDGRETIVYSASYAGDESALSKVLASDGPLLLTDSNRRRARRWRTMRHNTGYTERAGEQSLAPDYADARLDVFPAAGDDARTVAEYRGGAVVRATAYGNPIAYTAEDRPYHALDGDPSTAWRVGAFSDVRGQRLEIDLDHPHRLDHLTLLQPQTGPINRHITKVRITLDDQAPFDVALDDSSLAPPGQVVHFPETTARRVSIEIRDTDAGQRYRYDGLSPVGFAEVGVDGIQLDEMIRLPTDLMNAAGARSIDHPLTVMMTRLRADPAEPVKDDEELHLARVFTLPTPRTFRLRGTARLSDKVPDPVIDGLIGIPDAAHGGVTARSSERLDGDLRARASAALDGDPSTAWMPALGEQRGQWVEVDAGHPATLDHLDLRLVTDGEHSVPTRLRIMVDGHDAATVSVPEVPDRSTRGATSDVTVHFAPVTGRTIRVVVDDVRAVQTRDWYSLGQITLPVGIAELGVPGVRAPAPPRTLPSRCRALITVDGRPVSVRVTGTTASAVDHGALDVAPCDAASGGVALGRGDHTLQSSYGRDTGIDVDRLLLSSKAGGGAGPGVVREAPTVAPRLEVRSQGHTSVDVRVTGATKPFWLVLGQGYSDGWRASVDGGPTLGAPRLIDGFANGWLVDPSRTGDVLSISMRWTPQRVVWAGDAVSVIVLLLCLVLALWRPRRRRSRDDRAPASPIGSASRPGEGVVRLVLPLEEHPSALSWPWAVGLGAVMGVGVALTVLPGAGLAVGLVTAWVARRPRWTPMLAVGSVLIVGLSVSFVVAVEVVAHRAPGFSWPHSFEVVHVPVLTAVAFLVVDAALEQVRRAVQRGDV